MLKKPPKYPGGPWRPENGLSNISQLVRFLSTVHGDIRSDLIPKLVRFIPSWFPGAGWKRQGEEWRVRLNKLSGVPHAWVKQQMVNTLTASHSKFLLTKYP